MKGCLGFTTKTVFIVSHVIVAIMYLISRNIDSFAQKAGKIGFNAWGHRIPGDGLKALIKLLAAPFHLVGDNIKLLLAIDVIAILCFIIWAILKRRAQKNSVEDAATATTVEEKKDAFNRMMDAFKG